MGKILNSWSLFSFAEDFGTVVNKKQWEPEEGAPFSTLSFRPSKDSTKATYVHFSSNLGELSGKQLKEQRDDLQIVQIEVAPDVLARRAAKGQQLESYKLCRKGELDYGEEIDLW